MPPKSNLIYIAEAAKKVGIGKATLLRWLKDKKIPDVSRDVRGWRVFTEAEIKRIQEYANRIHPPDSA